MESYRFRPTYRGAKRVPAEVAAAELHRLDQTGGVTAQRVVNAARPPTAPLHGEFEWNNTVAAAAYRLSQARMLIRAIEAIVEPASPEEPREIRPMFIHVPDRQSAKPGTYVSSTILPTRPDQFALAINEALRFLESAEKSVAFLRRLAADKEDTFVAHVTIAQEGFHLVRTALAALRAA